MNSLKRVGGVAKPWVPAGFGVDKDLVYYGDNPGYSERTTVAFLPLAKGTLIRNPEVLYRDGMNISRSHGIPDGTVLKEETIEVCEYYTSARWHVVSGENINTDSHTRPHFRYIPD